MFLISPQPRFSQADAVWRTALRDGQIANPARFAEFMLTKVSRTFALNIRVLPAGMRRQVLLAYLFCRMADTLEDDAELDPVRKILLLESFRGLFPPREDWRERMEAFASELPAEWRDSESWDRLLVFHCRWILPQLREFSAPVIRVIADCVEEMCGGMGRFTYRQSRADTALIGSMEDLDSYCYYVAGTVGIMLCELFVLHSPLLGKKRAQALRKLSVSFGMGLQLTNILKDIHDDARRNVSFIPQSLLTEENLASGGFSDAQGGEAAARVLTKLIGKAKTHLEDALEYTCLLPRLEPRLRLFCLWPLFMAAETLVLLGRKRHDLEQAVKIKISRAQVKSIVRRTSFACWSNHWLRAQFRAPMSQLEAALGGGEGVRA